MNKYRTSHEQIINKLKQAIEKERNKETKKQRNKETKKEESVSEI